MNKSVMTLSLILSANIFAQVAHMAVCKPASLPPTTNNESLMSRIVADLGDANALASLKAIRYTTSTLTGADANPVNVVTLTRAYPDRLMVVTRIPSGTESYMEASPAGAFVQPAGGQRSSLPEEWRDCFVKSVRLDRFYVGQNTGTGKVSVTESGTTRIGDVEAAVLHVNVEGAEATWYVGRADGRLLRTVAKVPDVGGLADSVVDYSDWRNCDGLTVPFQRVTTQGGKTTLNKVLTVELNPIISALPSAASAAAAAREVLSDDEVNRATSGDGVNHWVTIVDMGLMAAQGNQQPAITLYMPEAVIAMRAASARRQFLRYEATEEDKKGSLTITAQGYAGKTIGEGCTSITRVALLSDPSGGIVQEAYLSKPLEETWQNSFGATNHCQSLWTKFSLADVQRVRAAAPNGEFLVAVFAGSVNTKMYKIKKKHQSKLGMQ
jgi:hypothetical protein